MYVACTSLVKEMKPHYLGALLVILAPNQGSIILWKRRRRRKKEKTPSVTRHPVENTFINSSNKYDLQQCVTAFLIENNANSREIWKSLWVSVCVPSANNPSRKVGVTVPRLGQTSGQFQQSTATSAFLRTCLISQQTSPRSLRQELMSALLCRLQILPISSNCFGSATFCTPTRQTFGPNRAVYL